MTQHRSLKSSVSAKGHRNVLKRLERIKKLREEERWNPDDDSIYGLPKVRSIKIKAKAKGRAEEEAAAEGAAAEGAAPAASNTEKKA